MVEYFAQIDRIGIMITRKWNGYYTTIHCASNIPNKFQMSQLCYQSFMGRIVINRTEMGIVGWTFAIVVATTTAATAATAATATTATTATAATATTTAVVVAAVLQHSLCQFRNR